MAISLNELISLARELVEKGEEVCQRSAANRAYLYSYLICKDLAGREQMPLPNDVSGSHERVIVAFKRSNDEELRETGILLEQLKTLRVKADYRIHGSFSISQAMQTIQTAETIRNIAQTRGA